jgi:periplasmic copper chaperone A
MTIRHRCRPALASMLLLAGLATAACGTGQVAQTAEQVTPWAGGDVCEIAVRDVAFPFRPPVAGDEVYRVGEIAPLSVTIVNHGDAADRLVRVSSPIASSGVLVAEGIVIPGGQTLTAGQEGPLASLEVSYENDAGLIALAGLSEPIRSGLSYPVIFEFERAGDVLVEVPVDLPDLPRREPVEGT